MEYLESFDFISENDWDLAFRESIEQEASEYTCPFCGKLIKNNSKILWINKHDKSFKCPGCREKVFWLG